MRGEVNEKSIDKGEANKLYRLINHFYIQDNLFTRFIETFNKVIFDSFQVPKFI
jgi:hypothetical protein